MRENFEYHVILLLLLINRFVNNQMNEISQIKSVSFIPFRFQGKKYLGRSFIEKESDAGRNGRGRERERKKGED